DRGLITAPNSLALRDLVADGDGYLALTGDPDRLQPALLHLRRDGSVDTTFGLAGRAAHPRARDVIPAAPATPARRAPPRGRGRTCPSTTRGHRTPDAHALRGRRARRPRLRPRRAGRQGGGRPASLRDVVALSPCSATGRCSRRPPPSGSSAMVHRFTPDGLRPDLRARRQGGPPRLAVPTFGQALRVAPDQRSVLVLSVASDGRLGLHRLAL
ncbi:MAG: hypothetical protein IPF99_30975, partial [Deltaproteobacteria bacterium]|nr:hypothetical protein [Deltaproteobacteria bacterium]